MLSRSSITSMQCNIKTDANSKSFTTKKLHFFIIHLAAPIPNLEYWQKVPNSPDINHPRSSLAYPYHEWSLNQGPSNFECTNLLWNNLPRIYVLIFSCYLPALRPTWGHSSGNSLTNPMFIPMFELFWPEGHQESHNEVGPNI